MDISIYTLASLQKSIFLIRSRATNKSGRAKNENETLSLSAHRLCCDKLLRIRCTVVTAEHSGINAYFIHVEVDTECIGLWSLE